MKTIQKCLWIAGVLLASLGVSTAVVAQQSVALPPAAVPPSQQSAVEPSAIEVPYQQTVTLQIAGANRVLSVNPAMVEAVLPSPGVITLHAVAFGQTFVHIWTPAGRLTRAVQVVQPVISRPSTIPEQVRAEELARHLTFEYQNRYRVQWRGPTPQDLDLTTSTTFDHNLSSHMETPYGNLSGRVIFQRLNSASEVSLWNASLLEGHLGPLEHFDVVGGDTGVGFSDLSLPQSSIRGIDIRYHDLAPYDAEAFYGHRRFGFATGLSPGAGAEDNVFFTGVRLQQLARPWTWSVAYAGASGDGRPEIQTNQAVEANSWYWLNENLRFGAEVGRNQENAYGYRLKSSLREGTLNVDAVYRNISQRYENLLGQSAEQGKRGVLLTSQYAPFRSIRLRERADLYQDTLFKNPQEPNRGNMEIELGADIDLTEWTVWSSSYERQRLLGRLFPTDATTISSGLHQRLGDIPLLARGTIFGEYEFRKVRSVNSPESDFESNSLRAGLGAPLWSDYLSWQVTQQLTFLDEKLSGKNSAPWQTTAGLNYSQRFDRIPLSLHSGLNFSIAHAGSANSFLANEDRWTWDAGARYDFSPDAHVFIDTRLARVSRPTGREYNLEIDTGLRYLFDTGISWEPSATISGIVFQDLNGDGHQQPGENGLPHIKVAAGVKEAVTDTGGRFYLGRVRGRRAKVSVDLASTPSGYVPTSPTTIEVDLAKPPSMPLLFGFVAQSELRVRVFIDTQENGQYDADDVPLEDIRVSLADGTTVKTDRSGWAFFRGIKPGSYRVTLHVDDLAVGYVPMTAVTQERALVEGKAALVDFPIKAERSISGRVYVDRNRNGHYEDGEPVLKDIPMCLDGVRRVRTLEDGRYFFKGVTAGLHRVAFDCGTPLPGYLPLNATVQTVEISPQPAQKEGVDFRLGEQAVIMQDVIADVLRVRREREQLVEEMVSMKKARREIQPKDSAKP